MPFMTMSASFGSKRRNKVLARHLHAQPLSTTALPGDWLWRRLGEEEAEMYRRSNPVVLFGLY